MGLGHWEIIALIVIALLIFGPKKIPELMRGLGRGIREFKSAMREDTAESEEKNRMKRPEAEEKENDVHPPDD